MLTINTEIIKKLSPCSSRFDYKIILPLQTSDDILGKRFKVTMTELVGEG